MLLRSQNSKKELEYSPVSQKVPSLVDMLLEKTVLEMITFLQNLQYAHEHVFYSLCYKFLK